ncbi:gastrula zinc finger protein xFG20-1-like [Planococcus citri]|uniref:gastrula zinc finger protein xFG20-1-like n=1 Tax=Planococcus citri TaxID=170843 RepID=UPI0031F83986
MDTPSSSFHSSNSTTTSPGKRTHSRTSYEEQPYHCLNNCGRTYKYRQSMMLHFKFECGKEPQFKCTFCSKKFAHKGNYTNSMNLIDGNGIQLDSNLPFLLSGSSSSVFACPNNCGKVYKYKGNMMLHFKQECGKEPAYVCKFCQKKFTKKGNLKTHLGLIHNSLDL